MATPPAVGSCVFGVPENGWINERLTSWHGCLGIILTKSVWVSGHFVHISSCFSKSEFQDGTRLNAEIAADSLPPAQEVGFHWACGTVVLGGKVSPCRCSVLIGNGKPTQ